MAFHVANSIRAFSTIGKNAISKLLPATGHPAIHSPVSTSAQLIVILSNYFVRELKLVWQVVWSAIPARHAAVRYDR